MRAALAAVVLCGAAHAQAYELVEGWLKLPASRETLGPMHGDVAVSNAGEVVLEISRDAIPREYWTENRFSPELGVLLSGMDVAPNGDLYVTDGYSSDYVHRFDSKGKYLGAFGGKAAPYGFNILHKIASAACTSSTAAECAPRHCCPRVAIEDRFERLEDLTSACPSQPLASSKATNRVLLRSCGAHMRQMHSRFGIALLLAAAVARAQSADPSFAMPPQVATVLQIQFKTDEFAFARIRYTGSSRPGAWATDYPGADTSFTAFVTSRTGLRAREPVTLELTDPSLPRYPFVYLVEGGRIDLSDAEVAGLRAYLSGGGFLLVDDCWGREEWAQLVAQIRRVIPDRPIVDIPTSHPIFSSFYRFDEIPVVPGLEVTQGLLVADVSNPHVRGVFGADGRLMMILLHNLDLGDSWEHAATPDYPRQYSLGAGVPFGINIVVYALSR